ALRDVNGLRPVQRRDLHLSAERGAGERDLDLAGDLPALAAELRVRLDADENVQVAGRAAVRTCFAPAGDLEPHALLDPGRDVHGDAPCLALASAPPAPGAVVLDHLAAAVAVVALGDLAHGPEDRLPRAADRARAAADDAWLRAGARPRA